MATITKTTEAEARQALQTARETYSRFGYSEAVETELVLILTTKNANQREAERRADQFRNLLWDTFSGGGVSASVTRKVYTTLGRSDETDDRWI